MRKLFAAVGRGIGQLAATGAPWPIEQVNEPKRKVAAITEPPIPPEELGGDLVSRGPSQNLRAARRSSGVRG